MFKGDYKMLSNDIIICRKCKITSETAVIMAPTPRWHKGFTEEDTDKELAKVLERAICEYCLFDVKV